MVLIATRVIVIETFYLAEGVRVFLARRFEETSDHD